MDFGWSTEQLQLRAEAEAFARAALSDGVEDDDRNGRFPREKWDALASWGFFGLSTPADLGGAGLDPMSALLATEGICTGCPDTGLLFSAVVQTWAILPTLLRFASTAQRQRYLPGLIRGTTVAALAVTEPDSGSDAFAMRTRAHPVAGGWRVDGGKAYITNAPVADLIVCWVRTGEGGPVGGVSAFLLDAAADGVAVGKPMPMQGLRTAPLGDVVLDGAFVPEGNLLGGPGFGLAVFNEAMEWERSFVMVLYLGMLERQLDNACRYARRRSSFGSPISKHQPVADRLVEMRLRLETARLLLYRACWLKAQGRSTLAESAMAKLWLSECAVASSLDAIQVHGAYGYAAESGVERDLRSSVAARIHSGTSEMQRLMIARSMKL